MIKYAALLFFYGKLKDFCKQSQISASADVCHCHEIGPEFEGISFKFGAKNESIYLIP